MKIICIINNFISNNNIHKDPVFLLKPDTSMLYNSKTFFIPQFSENISCSVSPVIKINRVGKNIAEKFAHRYYNEISVGIDLTDVLLLKKCKEHGLPWDSAKSFECSAPIGQFFFKNEFSVFEDAEVSLFVNDKIEQKIIIREMRFSVDYIISYVSQFFTIKTGDIIYLGTPEIDCPLQINDRIKAYINNKLVIDFFVK